MHFRSFGGKRRELEQLGDRLRKSGPGRVLGPVVRPVQDDRPRDRRAGQGLRGEDRVLQGQHRRLPQHRIQLRHPEHPDSPDVQERGEERECDRGCAKEHLVWYHRQVHGNVNAPVGVLMVIVYLRPCLYRSKTIRGL